MTKINPFPGYLRQEDVYRRLHNTLCLYKKQPCWVEVDLRLPCNTVHIQVLPFVVPKKATSISVCDPDFSAVFPSLGYVNSNIGAAFATRGPSRDQKQGLNVDQILGLRGITNNYGSAFLYEQHFIDMCNNVYPSFEEALQRAINESISVAFNKNFCIHTEDGRLLVLRHVNRNIGVYDETCSRFRLLMNVREESYMREKLSKLGVNALA